MSAEALQRHCQSRFFLSICSGETDGSAQMSDQTMADTASQSPELPHSSAETARHQKQNTNSILIRHGSWASLGRGFNLVFAFLNTFVLARVLAPEDFGRFALARTALMLFGIVATFGLEMSSLKLLGPYLADSNSTRQVRLLSRIFRAGILTTLVTAVIASTSCVQYGEVLTGGDSRTISMAIAFAAATIFTGFLNIASDSVRGVGAIGTANILGNVLGSPVLHGGTFLIVCFIALFREPSWEDATWAYALSALVGAAVGGVLLLRVLHRKGAATSELAEKPGGTIPNSSRILLGAWPFAAASVLSFISTRCDLFLTSDFKNPQDMPLYVGAQRAIILMVIPMSVLSVAVRGVIVPMYYSNMKSELERTVRVGASLVAVPCLLAALLTVIAPGFVLRIVLGDGYTGAETMLQILIIGQSIFVITGCCETLLNLTGHHRVVMWITAANVVLLLGLGPWVAEKYGPTGLALHFALLQSARNLAAWAIAWRLTGINTWCTLHIVGGLARLRRSRRKDLAGDGKSL